MYICFLLSVFGCIFLQPLLLLGQCLVFTLSGILSIKDFLLFRKYCISILRKIKFIDVMTRSACQRTRHYANRYLSNRKSIHTANRSCSLVSIASQQQDLACKSCGLIVEDMKAQDDCFRC